NLFKRVGLHFDLQARMLGPDFLDGAPDAPGQDDVVVLDQDGIVQAEPMVGGATGPHSVLLELSQRGSRLPGVEHDDASACGVDEPRGERGNARQSLKKIQRGALADEQGASRSRDFGNGLAAAAAYAVARPDDDLYGGIERAKTFDGDIEPGDHA